SVESAAHVPSHCPFFWFGQHADKRQLFCKSLADFRRPIIRAWPEICHQKQFPFKAKQRHYLVKILDEWNNFFFRAITKHRNGKLDRRFDHYLQRKSYKSHDPGKFCQGVIGSSFWTMILWKRVKLITLIYFRCITA